MITQKHQAVSVSQSNNNCTVKTPSFNYRTIAGKTTLPHVLVLIVPILEAVYKKFRHLSSQFFHELELASISLGSWCAVLVNPYSFAVLWMIFSEVVSSRAEEAGTDFSMTLEYSSSLIK